MHKIRHYMKTVESDDHKVSKLHDILCKGMAHLAYIDKDYYVGMIMGVHEVVYGPHFDEALAKEAVSEMQNVDGSKGGHWSMEQTNKTADQHGIHQKCDFYYLINMLWSDYSAVMGNDAETYVKMAKAYMNDPDGNEGKAYKQYMAKFL